MPSAEILVDSKESKSMEILLREAGLSYRIEDLPVGDYVVDGVVIEFKEIQDFFNSLKSGRLWYQMKAMKEQSLKPLLVICGRIPYNYATREQWARLSGARIGYLLFGIPSWTVDSREEFVALLKLMAERSPSKAERPRGVPLLKAKSKLSIEEIRVDMLRAVPGLGLKKAQRLVSAYGNIQKLVEAPWEDIVRLIGKNDTLKEVLYGEV